MVAQSSVGLTETHRPCNTLGVRGGALVLAMVSACGDNNPGGPLIEQSVELPLLVSSEPDIPFNQSAEASIAAHEGRVVVGAIQLHFAAADGFMPDQNFRKRVAVYVSNDEGATFDVLDPELGDGTLVGDQTTDPVMRATSDGAFYLMVGHATDDGSDYSPLAHADDGRTWQIIATPEMFDKQWFAIDETTSQIYVGATGGYWRYSFDGTLAAEVVDGMGDGHQMTDAYAIPGGVRFASGGTPLVNQQSVIEWDGASVPQVIASFDGGTNARRCAGASGHSATARRDPAPCAPLPTTLTHRSCCVLLPTTVRANPSCPHLTPTHSSPPRPPTRAVAFTLPGMTPVEPLVRLAVHPQRGRRPV